MKTDKCISTIAFILSLLLNGCGEPPNEAQQAKFMEMSDEKLKQEVVRLMKKCRAASEQTSDLRASCKQFNLAEDAAKARGWCWGPSAAAVIDKSWMHCSDDVTGDPQASRPWFAVNSEGVCRAALPIEAISYVVGHGEQLNVKTSFSAEGFLQVSNQQANGETTSAVLYPSCDAPLMIYIRAPNRSNALALVVPLGISPREAGDLFGFDARSCSGYSFGGTGLGCMQGLEKSGKPPIRMSDEFTPCRVGGTIQYDFALNTGMVGVTCSATKESLNEFNHKMTAAFGEQMKDSSGGALWTVGQFSVRSIEYSMLGTTLRSVSVFKSGS